MMMRLLRWLVPKSTTRTPDAGDVLVLDRRSGTVQLMTVESYFRLNTR